MADVRREREPLVDVAYVRLRGQQLLEVAHLGLDGLELLVVGPRHLVEDWQRVQREHPSYCPPDHA